MVQSHNLIMPDGLKFDFFKVSVNGHIKKVIKYLQGLGIPIGCSLEIDAIVDTLSKPPYELKSGSTSYVAVCQKI
jgi:hypothetical protein